MKKTNNILKILNDLDNSENYLLSGEDQRYITELLNEKLIYETWPNDKLSQKKYLNFYKITVIGSTFLLQNKNYLDVTKHNKITRIFAVISIFIALSALFISIYVKK